MAKKLKNKTWFYVILLILSSIIISFGAGILNEYTYRKMLFIDTFIFIMIYFIIGAAVLNLAAYISSQRTIKASPEWCIMWIMLYVFLVLIPPHIYDAYSLYNTAYVFAWNTDCLPYAGIVFSVLTLPLAFMFGLSLCRLVALIKQNKLREKSSFLKLITFLGNKKSMRSRLFILTYLVSIITATVSIAVIYIVIYTGDLYIFHNNLWIVMPIPIILELIALTVLLCSNKSVGGDMDKIADIINKTTEGNFITDNPLPETSLLHDTGAALIKLGEITSDGIQKGIAGEKLKVELITNVSHDLRTPLTSIIGYCEQLEAMKLPDEAAECVMRLSHKAHYLHDMTDDLFDLAKAASGNANITLTELNMHKLIEQTLGEMNDRIEQSGFIFKLNLSANNAMVLADGMRLHRVIENLISNALKYALKGTRIFISSANTADNIVVTILNTASYDMNFGNMDLTERFSRGDTSRTGEGSGLGLAIAKTYTEALGGRFDINIKGDQFEAVVTLPNIQ
ncbi:MAG: HAMP domain-containing histidine kinase [Lachnospiraceae bacterium]|nr:HAMP domain-containing histidine kinase [Lachnospiraceae bacterium]